MRGYMNISRICFVYGFLEIWNYIYNLKNLNFKNILKYKGKWNKCV